VLSSGHLTGTTSRLYSFIVVRIRVVIMTQRRILKIRSFANAQDDSDTTGAPDTTKVFLGKSH